MTPFKAQLAILLRTHTTASNDWIVRRPGKSDHSVAKLSYGGGMRRIDRRSWILDQAWIGEGLEFGLPERKAQHVMERSEVECGA